VLAAIRYPLVAASRVDSTGEALSVDASLIKADVDKKKRMPGGQPITWPKPEDASRAVPEYLAALDNARNEENGGDDGGLSGRGNRRRHLLKRTGAHATALRWTYK
jgi:hypothetical protein